MNARVHHPLEVVRAARERAGRKVTARVGRVAVRLGRKPTRRELRRLAGERGAYDWVTSRAERLNAGYKLAIDRSFPGRAYLTTRP